MSQIKHFTKGFFKENPILVLILGTCPTLATTSSAINGIGMGLATTFVLIGSNVVISLIAKLKKGKLDPEYALIIFLNMALLQLKI